jgi:hypothetical protein
MSFVVRWFWEQERLIGLRNVQHFYPDYLRLTATITDIQEKIEQSRGDRTRLRESIYNGIEEGPYDEILALYKQMRSSRERVDRLVRREKWKDRILWFFGVAGFLALIVSIVHVYLYYLHG